MADDILYGRRCRLLLSLPSATAGDYQGTLTDIIEINSGEEVGRRYQQSLADPQPPGLRIQFSAKKTGDKTPNSGSVTITNLAPQTRAQLQQKGVRVRLEAGYAATGVFGVFSGDVRTAESTYAAPDWQTKLTAGDGERAVRFARANESFSRGTTAGAVLTHLADRMGLDLGNSATQASRLTARFEQGYVVTGSAERALTRLLSAFGYEWSIQDGALQVLQPGEALSGLIPEISASSGLVGSPEICAPEKKGKRGLIKFQALLFATRPGARVRLKSAAYDGETIIKRCGFDGDTWGGQWYTSAEAELTDAR